VVVARRWWEMRSVMREIKRREERKEPMGRRRALQAGKRESETL
jgi:hypothetical protein